MSATQVLSPETPRIWLMARLMASQSLLDLLGSGATFPAVGQSFAVPPIYQAGEVPDDHPARFVVVKPPLAHDQSYYAESIPRNQQSTFLIYAETRNDKLPTGKGLDDVLMAIRNECAKAVAGVPQDAHSASGGHVWSSNIVGAYTPPAAVLNNIRIKQSGFFLNLLSTV